MERLRALPSIIGLISVILLATLAGTSLEGGPKMELPSYDPN
jgi:hypothetical protein